MILSVVSRLWETSGGGNDVFLVFAVASQEVLRLGQENAIHGRNG